MALVLPLKIKITASSNTKVSLLIVFALRMSLKICVWLIILVSIKQNESALLYPQFTVMQLIGSVSIPIADLSKDRKVFFDWGLQMNYDMPYNISSAYASPIWPTKGLRGFSQNPGAVHAHDFTAEDLYNGLAKMLSSYGYDRSCLNRSVCELFQTPFDGAYGNVVTDVINFLLKSLIHQGFSANESSKDSVYSLAEDEGFFGKSCRDLYPKCIDSLLNIFTNTEENVQ